MSKKPVIALVALSAFSLACTLFGPLTAGEPTGPESGQPAQPGSGQPAVSPDPVGIREGLASLDSYIQVMEWTSIGPIPTDQDSVRIETQRDRIQDAKLVHYMVTQSSEGDTEPSTTDSYNYSRGMEKCAGNEEDGWEYSVTNPQEQEMTDLLRTMTDVVPLIDNPVFVGAETVNGVATNHFTFQISGLGLTSGAQVTANQGDYWLAQDGQYIVKYFLVIETIDPTDQTTIHMEFSIDLREINQPVAIVFPAGCVP